MAGRRWPALHQLLLKAAIPHSYYLSEYKGHGRELARTALESGYRNFVVVGGDGTANEILNGLLADHRLEAGDFSLGIVPWGTGNDWAGYYGFSTRPEGCVQTLCSGLSSLQDLGRVAFKDEAGNSQVHYFLNCAGAGFDSYLLQEMKTSNGRRFRYMLYLLKCLRKFRAAPLQLATDERSFQGPAMLMEICLGKYAGAGMRFAPAAAADDGLFDVLLIKELSAMRLLGSLLYLYNGRINRHRAVSSWQCRSVSLSGNSSQWLHCDGELVGRLPVEIEILPRALRVLTATGQRPGV